MSRRPFWIPYVAIALGLHVLSSGWISMAIYHVGMLVWLWIDRDKLVWPRFSKRAPWFLALAAVVMGLMGGVLIEVLWPWLNLDDRWVQLLADVGLSGRAWTLFVLYHLTINPLLEEMFWRGTRSSSGFGPSLEDWVFAGYHVLVLVLFLPPLWVAVSFVILGVSAWIWRLLFHHRGGLLLPWLSHAAADASILLLFWMRSPAH